MQSPSTPPAFNPVPPVVWGFALVILAIEALFSLGEMGVLGNPHAIGWRVSVLNDYAFSGAIFDWIIEHGQLPLDFSIRFVSYLFLNTNFTSAIFCAVLILTMGNLVSTAMGQWGFVIIFLFSGVFGAIIFGFLTSQPWLVGAFPSAYGLIGAYTFLMWQRLIEFGAQGTQQLAAFRLIGFLMAIQLLFGILFNTGQDWIAELAGFVCGFCLTVIVMPGGLARIRTLIQRR